MCRTVEGVNTIIFVACCAILVILAVASFGRKL